MPLPRWNDSRMAPAVAPTGFAVLAKRRRSLMIGELVLERGRAVPTRAQRLEGRDAGLGERPERLENPVDVRRVGAEVGEHRRRLVGEVADAAHGRLS